MKLITTTGIIIFENDKPTLKETISDAIQSDIKNMENIKGVEFLSNQFDIRPENRITVYRYNNGNKSPFNTVQSKIKPTVWDITAKAIKTDNLNGIYGVTAQQVYSGRCHIFTDAFGDASMMRQKDLNFIKLEVDRNNVICETDQEIAFTQCNIIREVALYEFAKTFPQYKEMVYWYEKSKEMDNDLFYNALLSSVNRAENRDMSQRSWESDEIGSPIHGIPHRIRVERNGCILAEKTGANITILRLFSYYHDICRESDGSDPEHGLRASLLLKSIRNARIFELSDELFNELCFACANHTNTLRSGNVTIDTCFDSDRLDLTRLGIKPDPERMATEIGAYYAANPDEFKNQIELWNKK